MKLFVLLVWGATPMAAQFSGLATDDSGSRVWFSSPLNLRTAPDTTGYAKVFSADAQGNVALAAQSAPYDLSRTEVSGDGSVLVSAGSPGCHYLGAGCQYLNAFESLLYGTGEPVKEEGIYHLSRSGRYAMRESYYYAGPTEQIGLIDLASGHRTPIAVGNFQSLVGGGRQVTADGTGLGFAEDQLWLFRQDGSAQPVPASIVSRADQPFAGRAAVDEAGKLIVYQDNVLGGCSIVMVLPDRETTRMLVASPDPCVMESLSPDGATVLLVGLGTSQAWVVDTESKAMKQVSHDVAGIAEATLSGDGRVVWAATFGGRLLRVDLVAGRTDEIIPQTPYLDQVFDPQLQGVSLLIGAPGMLLHLPGRGLAPRANASDVQVLMDGRPIPVVTADPTEIVFQTPWSAEVDFFPPAHHTISLPDNVASPFAQANSRDLFVLARNQTFWPNPNGGQSFLHEDFRGLVTALDPARPDEILHVYATGLGGVSPPVEDGRPATATPLSFVQPPMAITWDQTGTAEVLFEGLAPGLVGVDQVDIRVPHNAPRQLSLWGASIWVRQ